jgi:lipopolysaccharide biosynthesis regulator YciM
LQLYLCQILLKQGQWEECNLQLQMLQSSRPEVLLVKGDLALASSDFEQAWQSYTSVMDMRYYTEDINLLAKATIAALGAGKDWESMLKRLREQDDLSGLPDYVEAQADLRRGDLISAQAKLQSALDRGNTAGLAPEIMTLHKEITARITAEPAIQAVIAGGGH